MGFLGNTKAVLDTIAENGGSNVIHEGLQEIEKPVRNLFSGKMFKSLGDFGQGALDLPLQTAMGAAMLYPAVNG
jgi:hypothetical protein